MKRLKAVAVRLLSPPSWAAAAVSLAGYGGVIWVLVHGCTGPLAYFAYLMSAYALAVDIVALPGLRRSLKKWAAHFKKHSRALALLRKTALGRQYLDSPLFRARFSLYQGMAVNLLENGGIRVLPVPSVGDAALVQNIEVDVGGEFGHETVSRVVKVGKNVTEFEVGERVYPYPRYTKNDTRRAGTDDPDAPLWPSCVLQTGPRRLSW